MEELRQLGVSARQNSINSVVVQQVSESPKPESDKIRVETLEEFKIFNLSLNNAVNGVNFSSIASLDSSSRLMRSTFISLGIVGGTVKSDTKGILNFPFDIDGKFVYSISYLELMRKLANGNFKRVEFKNPVGYEYAFDEVEYEDSSNDSLYDVNDMLDEARLRVENELIKSVNDDLLIIDGPIYPTPIELVPTVLTNFPKDKDSLKHWGKPTHRWSIASLILERVKLLKDRKAIGIVKRLENSRKLGKVIPGLRGLADNEVLDIISEKNCSNVIYPDLCVVGPLKLVVDISVRRDDTSQVILTPNDLPPRYSYYVIVRIPGGIKSFFRVESFDLNVLQNALPIVFSTITYSVLPLWIEQVDNSAKRVAKGLFYLSFNVLKDILSFLHDTKLAAIQISREIEAEKQSAISELS